MIDKLPDDSRDVLVLGLDSRTQKNWKICRCVNGVWECEEQVLEWIELPPVEINQNNVHFGLFQCLKYLSSLKNVRTDLINFKMSFDRKIDPIYHDFHPVAFEQVSPVVTTIVVEDRRKEGQIL